jgi:hypothetical protein
MAKVIIHLREHELTALHNLAQREYRLPRIQAAWIIRQELHRLGLIPAEPETILPLAASSKFSEAERDA